MKNKIINKFYNLTFLIIVIVAVVLINIISSFVNRRIDMTEDQRYSLANGTKEYLKTSDNFTSRINLKIYLDGNLPAELSYFKTAVEDKLKEFKQYAGDRIEYQFIDPNIGTEEEKKELFDLLWAGGQGILPMNIVYNQDGTQHQMMLWPGAVIEYGGTTKNVVQLLPGSKTDQPYQLKALGDVIQNSVNNLEYMLISSLRRATQNKKPRIAFLHGHNELEFKNTQRVRALLSPYYAVSDVSLNDSIHALDGLDGLIIARPETEFSDKDLYLIDQFVMKGGRLMCFTPQLYIPEDTLMKYGQTSTYRYNNGLSKLLFDYGVKLNDNYVLDARCVLKPVPLKTTHYVPWFFHVLATTTSHPIARNVEPISLKYVNEVQFVPQQENIALTPVLTSSTNATKTGLAPLVNLQFPLTYGENPELVADPTNENNKICIAGLAEGKFTSYFKNRIVDEFIQNKEVGYLEKGTKEGKVFVIGNSNFIKNDYDSTLNEVTGQVMYRPKPLNNLQFDEGMAQLQIPHFFGNQEFIQNLVDYMMGDNSVLDIRSRQIDIHEIDKEKVAKSATYYKIINLALPILFIVLLALTMGFIRRKKYAK